MMSQWVGFAISVNCGDTLGCYQGTIVEADGSTITLAKPFRNGFPYPKSQVTLNAADIKDLKIIEARADAAGPAHSTVAVTKSSKKSQRATVCETLQANPTSTGNQAAGGGASKVGGARSKPIDIQGARGNRNNTHAGSYGTSGSGGRGEKARRRNEACFGAAADDIDDDFDFEGNLALFDKRALWEQMSAARPDLLRHAERSTNLRPHEHVLQCEAWSGVALRVPAALRAPLHYVTDEGVVVQGASERARAQLWAAVERAGLWECSATLMARALADLCVRVCGGGRRLHPSNLHQAPRAAALCAPNRGGAIGLRAARLLASHGVRCSALLVGEAGATPACVRAELAAAGAGGVSVVREAGALPPALDLLVVALHDPQLDEPADKYDGAVRWVRGVRAAVVVSEPAAGWGAVEARAALQGVAPGAPHAALGRLYLADVAPPPAAFTALAMEYRSPFGAHSLLPLHPADDH